MGRHAGDGWRLSAAAAAGLIVWVLILARLFMIQAVHGPVLADLAKRQHIAEVPLAAARGTIFDRNMVALTENLTVRSVCAYPSEIKSPRSVARSLARVLGGSYDLYLDRLCEERDFVWIERQIPPDQAKRLAELDLPGIDFLKESKRVYPNGRRACHLLGLTDVDGRGIAGIEKQMDEELTGSEARVYYCVDAVGRRTPTPACTKVVPRDGMSVVLTIDLDLQSIAEVELERAVRENEALHGMVVIEDPWTGEILAIASWPSFDPNCASRYSIESQKNRPVTDQFEPGSTFKLVTACAALSTQAAQLNSVYYAGRGSKSFGRFTIRDVHPYGWLDFTGALVHSSNICFAQIGESVGAFPLYSFAKGFGFGCPTGIELPGEVRGVLRDPSEWSARSAETIAIGQEVAVTGLQLVSAYSAVANGGYLMEPRILKAIVTEDGRVAEEPRPAVVRRAVDPRIAEIMRQLLTRVTEDGTGRNARVEEFIVAGKTGTAQKTAPGVRGFAPGKYVSSFVGMAPAEDPEVVCLVMIDEPKGRGLGGEVAAPVFSRIVERIVRSPSCGYVLSDSRRRPAAPAGAEKAVVGLGVAIAASHGGAAVAVPAVFESSEAAVAHTCADAAPPADAVAAVERPLVPCVDVSGETVPVPDLRGASVRWARRAAAESGLVLEFEGTGLVREQTPRPGSRVHTGHKVIVSCYPR